MSKEKIKDLILRHAKSQFVGCCNEALYIDDAGIHKIMKELNKKN